MIQIAISQIGLADSDSEGDNVTTFENVYKTFVKLEEGIMEAEKLRDDESLFSTAASDDIDDKIKKYESEKNHKTQAMINYQY